MLTLDSLKQSILTECEEDYVGLWSVIRDVEDHFPKKGEAAIREQVLRLLLELLLANEIRAGFPDEEGKFRSLRTTPEKILERIAAEWSPGQRPTIGEGLWFTRTQDEGSKSEELHGEIRQSGGPQEVRPVAKGSRSGVRSCSS